jgi:hypothetical protein
MARTIPGGEGGGNALKGGESVIPDEAQRRSGIVGRIWLSILRMIPGSASQLRDDALQRPVDQTNWESPGIEPTIGPITSSPAFSRP